MAAMAEQPGTCPICLNDFDSLHKMNNCAHSFCQPCLASFIASAKPVSKASLCPVCKAPMQDTDIVKAVGEQGLAQLRQQQQQSDAADVEGGYAEDAASAAAFLRTVRQRHMRLCPACGTTIEKNGGCNNMRCRCGHTFDWRTAQTVVPCSQLHVDFGSNLASIFGYNCPNSSLLGKIKLYLWRIFAFFTLAPVFLIVMACTRTNILYLLCFPFICCCEALHICLRSVHVWTTSKLEIIEYKRHKSRYPYGPETSQRTRQINRLLRRNQVPPTIVLTGDAIGCAHISAAFVDTMSEDGKCVKSAHASLAKFILSRCIHFDVIQQSDQPRKAITEDCDGNETCFESETIRNLFVLETVREIVMSGQFLRSHPENNNSREAINNLLLEFLTQIPNTGTQFGFQGNTLTAVQAACLLCYHYLGMCFIEDQPRNGELRIVFTDLTAKTREMFFSDFWLIASVCNVPRFRAGSDPQQLRSVVNDHISRLNVPRYVPRFCAWWGDDDQEFDAAVFGQAFPELEAARDYASAMDLLNQFVSNQLTQNGDEQVHFVRVVQQACPFVAGMFRDVLVRRFLESMILF